MARKWRHPAAWRSNSRQRGGINRHHQNDGKTHRIKHVARISSGGIGMVIAKARSCVAASAKRQQHRIMRATSMAALRHISWRLAIIALHKRIPRLSAAWRIVSASEKHSAAHAYGMAAWRAQARAMISRRALRKRSLAHCTPRNRALA